MKIDNNGVNYTRKGEATYFCMVNSSSHHIVAVCNIPGWTMGTFKDTYIQYEESVDKYAACVQ